MSVTITIPDSIVGAIKLPEAHLQESLREELAVTLYADGALSFGKARELAEVGKFEFGQLLAKHSIPRHYTSEELEDDLKYAGCQ
jgi:predicted HTH domain antitoxin